MPLEFWLLVIGVIMFVAVIVAAWLRQRHSQQTVRLELVNEGNMRSRYQLRAEDPANDLSFCFSLGGDSLPEDAVFDEEVGAESAADLPAPSRTPVEADLGPGSRGVAGGIQQKAGQATSSASSFAATLTALGSTLPRPLGTPLMRIASQLQQGQIRASRAQRAPRQVASLRGRFAKPAVPRAAAAAGAMGSEDTIGSARPAASAHRSAAHVWAETPSLAPGEAMILDLRIRSASASKDQQHTFQVISRSVEGKDSPWVVAESSVQLRGGIWARRYLPQILIVAFAVLAFASVTFAIIRLLL